jgi:hypothetical protein
LKIFGESSLVINFIQGKAHITNFFVSVLSLQIQDIVQSFGHIEARHKFRELNITISMEQTIISAFSQPLVSVLLNNFIEEAVSVVHFRNNFLAMCEQLEFVRLVLDSMLNLQNTSNSIKHWLERLQKTLEDAEELVDECNCGDIAFHNLIQRYRLARKIKGLMKRIKGLKKDASVVSLLCQMNGHEAQNQNQVWSRSARVRSAVTAFPTILEPYTVGIQTNVLNIM